MLLKRILFCCKCNCWIRSTLTEISRSVSYRGNPKETFSVNIDVII